MMAYLIWNLLGVRYTRKDGWKLDEETAGLKSAAASAAKTKPFFQKSPDISR